MIIFDQIVIKILSKNYFIYNSLIKPEFHTCNGQMIALCPKSYIAHCRDISETKDGRKGIPNYINLTVEQYLDTLYERVFDHRVEVRSLRKVNKEGRIGRTKTLKSGLSNIHVKLQVDQDRVSCRPLQYPDGSFV